MVKSRYLCSAPRPETWDERAEALLKSLGGSATQQETMLRETLDSLKVMHADKQKTGPGRKSNAEHAIAFYEYVLETITENQEGPTEEAAAEPAPAAAPAEVPVKRKRGRPRKNPLPTAADQRPAKKNRVVIEKTEAMEAPTAASSATAGSGADDQSVSIASMDTQEFINQHNDLCEVCNTGGELLMCSTCNLVFHLHCVRPKMEEAPPDSWVCSYCVMSGVKGLKQNSKMRKSAAVAVRLMARMRKQLQRQRNKQQQPQQQPQQQQADEGDAYVDVSESSGDPDTNGEQEQPQQQAVAAAGETASSSSSDSVKAQAVEPATSEASTPKDSDSQQPAVESAAAAADYVKVVKDEIDIDASDDDDKKPPPDDTDNDKKLAATVDGKVQELTDSKEGETATDDTADLEATESTDKSEAAAADDDETPRKHNKENKLAEEAGSAGRVRRNRKKANYYNPQSGAASRWQSDGANEWKYLSQHSDDDEVDDVSEDDDRVRNGELKTEEPKEEESQDDIKAAPASKKGSKKGSPHCHFCNDDKSIPVCCFCACRVCFGKHDQTKLLLCDNCDGEYHTFCLSPPLKSVPSSQSWFCPSCVDAAERGSPKVGTRGSKSSPAEKASATRASGRKSSVSPKAKKAVKANGKAKSIVAAEPPPVKRGPGRPRKHPLPEPYVGPPRKRGRPPKNKSPSPPAKSSISPPKKRGRPRKNPLPSASVSPPKKRASPSPGPQPVKRGPGRPPKNGPGRPPKTGPGRPSKNANKKRSRSPAPQKIEEKKRGETKPRPKAASVKDDNTAASTVAFIRPPVKKSRSGRAVKRSSFHDEIDEGEQHLKSSRYAAELQRQAAMDVAATAAEPFFMNAQVEVPAVAAGGIQHVDGGYASHHHHHDVDPHFLENIPVGGNDLSALAHLDTIIMDPQLNVDAMHVEAMQMDAAMNLDVAMEQPHALGETMHAEEGDNKPAAVAAQPIGANLEVSNEVRPAPVVESLSESSSTSSSVTNENPPSPPTVADPAPTSVGNTVPAVGVLTAGPPSATATVPIAEEAPKAAAAAFGKLPAAPAAAALPSKPAARAVAALPPISEAPTVAALPSKSEAPVVVAHVPPKPVPAAPAVAALPQAQAAHTPPSVAAAAQPSYKPAPIPSLGTEQSGNVQSPAKVPRRKPGARECMQISRRFGVNEIPDKWMGTLLDYCKRGKVEHLIRMRERLDEHSRFLELQLAGIETLVQERGESDAVVPAMPEPENEGPD